MNKYKLVLAIVLAVVSLGIFSSVFATVAELYTRTPALPVFQYTTVNFEGYFSTQGNADSYKIVVDGVSSACVNQEPADDQLEYNVNMSVPIGPHHTVQLWSYESNDDECEEYPHVYHLEGIEPAFTVTN